MNNNQLTPEQLIPGKNYRFTMKGNEWAGTFYRIDPSCYSAPMHGVGDPANYRVLVFGWIGAPRAGEIAALVGFTTNIRPMPDIDRINKDLESGLEEMEKLHP